MSDNLYDFGMIGLGVMGRNFLLNMADHGFAVIGFDLDAAKASTLESSATAGTNVKGVSALADMITQLKAPRKIMMLVPAGKPVDDVIESLLPLVSPGDIIIDGGNSHYTDTLRRVKYLQEKNIHFMGMGVSGGEEGARRGPSIMPGGDEKAWNAVKPLLQAVSAKVNKEACVAYMGKDAAGHYVKMVHNGIEYAIMQIISEVYDAMKRGMNLTNDEMHSIFKSWNEKELQSFLVEITADVFIKKDDITGNALLDMILDKAGSKGTGKWTSQDAMDLPVSIPSIDMAVAMRDISSYKDERAMAASLYQPLIKNISGKKETVIKQLHDVLYFSMLMAYAQGLSMLHKASKQLQMDIPLADVVKIWRGGCIIRSTMLQHFYKAYKKNAQLQNLLLDEEIMKRIKRKEKNTRKVVATLAQCGIPAGAINASLAYFDAYTSARMPVNLIQAQRDYFGAHTYQRTDKEGTFHSDWKP